MTKKQGRKESKYTYKQLGSLINLSDVQLFKLKDKDEELREMLILGIILRNEKDNKKFWKTMERLKKEDKGNPHFVERTIWEFPKTKKWLTVDITLISDAINFIENYGIDNKDVTDFFNYEEKKRLLLEEFNTEMEENSNIKGKDL